MTTDVTAFLRAAHDEIERVARASREQQRPIIERMEGDDDPHVWRAYVDHQPGCPPDSSVFSGDGDGAHVATTSEDEDLRTAAHIALHDPRAALARVQAERALVAWCDDDPLCHDGGWAYTDTTLRWLAYGHRHTIPGYDPAWAPEDLEVDA